MWKKMKSDMDSLHLIYSNGEENPFRFKNGKRAKKAFKKLAKSLS